MSIAYPYIYVWKNNSERAKFHKARCRIVKQMRSTVLVEFENGFRMVTSLNALRKPKNV